MENNYENLEKKIEITTASPEDVRGMIEVFYKTWLATYPNEEYKITVDDIEDRFKDSFTDENLKKRAERITNPPEGEMTFLAKEDESVVGLVRIVRHPDRNQLQAIYVLPQYQRKGIGYLLWEEARKHFDQTIDTIVNVAIYNIKAIEFYKKLGFKETGKVWEDEKFKLKSGAIISETELIMKGTRR